VSASRITCPPLLSFTRMCICARVCLVGQQLDAKMVFTEADYSNVLDYLRLGSYPKVFTKNERRTLRRKAECFRVKSRVLYYAGRWSAAGNLRRVVNDDLINKAQELLKREFPYVGGLQPVALGMTMAFSIEPGEFVQILHTGHGHWITISTIGCIHPEVQVYDSLVPAPTSNLFRQVATLLATANTSISLKYVDVTMQNGSADCGLFAIAFATALINGCDPSQLFFDQAKMRHHLAKCIMAGKMSEFPVKKM